MTKKQQRMKKTTMDNQIIHQLRNKLFKALDFAIGGFGLVMYGLFYYDILVGQSIHDLSFVYYTIGLGYYIYRSMDKYKGTKLMIWGNLLYTFFFSLAGCFIYHWVIFKDPSVWIFKTIIVFVAIVSVMNIIKYIKNKFKK